MIGVNASLHGNSYTRIYFGSNSRPGELEPLSSNQVSSPVLYKRKLYYEVEGEKDLIPNSEMIHIKAMSLNGYSGLSPIKAAAENIGISLAAQKFGAKFFENGAHLGGAVTHPGQLKKEGYERLKNDFAAKNAGVDNVGKTLILEEGMKYEKIGIPPEDAQFIETRQFGRSEIAGIFRVPPHMIADMSESSYSNIENQDINFAKHTLLPWIARIEQEFNKKLFRESEKGRFYIKFNLNGLLRGNSQDRAQFYKEMWQMGVFTQNDILELEDMNTFDGGERRYIPTNNMGPIDLIDQVFLAKQAIREQINGNGKKNINGFIPKG